MYFERTPSPIPETDVQEHDAYLQRVYHSYAADTQWPFDPNSKDMPPTPRWIEPRELSQDPSVTMDDNTTAIADGRAEHTATNEIASPAHTDEDEEVSYEHANPGRFYKWLSEIPPWFDAHHGPYPDPPTPTPTPYSFASEAEGSAHLSASWMSSPPRDNGYSDCSNGVYAMPAEGQVEHEHGYQHEKDEDRPSGFASVAYPHGHPHSHTNGNGNSSALWDAHAHRGETQAPAVSRQPGSYHRAIVDPDLDHRLVYPEFKPPGPGPRIPQGQLQLQGQSYNFNNNASRHDEQIRSGFHGPADLVAARVRCYQPQVDSQPQSYSASVSSRFNFILPPPQSQSQSHSHSQPTLNPRPISPPTPPTPTSERRAFRAPLRVPQAPAQAEPVPTIPAQAPPTRVVNTPNHNHNQSNSTNDDTNDCQYHPHYCTFPQPCHHGLSQIWMGDGVASPGQYFC